MKKSFNYILILGFIGVISCDNKNKTAIEKEVKVIKTIDANGVSKTDSVILEKTNFIEAIEENLDIMVSLELVEKIFIK